MSIADKVYDVRISDPHGDLVTTRKVVVVVWNTRAFRNNSKRPRTQCLRKYVKDIYGRHIYDFVEDVSTVTFADPMEAYALFWSCGGE